MKDKFICPPSFHSAWLSIAICIASAVTMFFWQTAKAATIIFDRDYSYATPRTDWLAATNDLINQGQPTLLTTSFSGIPYGASSETKLNDGSNSGFFGNFADGFAADFGTFEWTVDLNQPTNVTKIVVYSGGDYNVGSQDFMLEYRVVGSTNYTTLFTNLDQGGGNTPGSSVAIRLTILPSGSELQNIDSLRFTFPNGYSGYPLYTEVDVFGEEVVVPPPGVTLTFDRDYSYNAAPIWIVATNDLVNQGETSLLATSTSGPGAPLSPGSYANLNNGSNGGFDGNVSSGFMADLGTCIWTAELNGPRNVDKIVVYSGGDYNVGSQNFQLEYRVSGSNDYTTLFATLDQGGNNTPGSSIAIRLTITPLGAALQNVDSLRFTFPNGYPNYPKYNEIDVFEKPPTLGIAVENSKAIVFWPTNAGSGFVLQTNASLTSAVWINAATPVVVGDQYFTTNNILGSALFFRLQK